MGALGAPRVDHHDPSAAVAEVAEVTERVRQHHAVAVRDDGVHADGQQQLGAREVRLELQLHAGHQLRHEELRWAIDAQRAVALVAAQVAHERLGQGIARWIERPASAGVVGNDVRAVVGDQGPEAHGNVIQRLVPRARHELAVASNERHGRGDPDGRGTPRRRDPWSTCIRQTTGPPCHR